MHLISEHHLDDGLLERRFVLDGVPGLCWTPSPRPSPLILLGHPGRLDAMHPRLLARARSAAADGHASATLELPGSGTREPLPEVDAARDELRAAVMAGEPVPDDVVDRLVLPLVDRSVPEWQSLIDALVDTHGPFAWSGGVVGIGVRLAAVEPRLVAAGLFAGSYVPRATLDDARRVTIPAHVLLQWDDEGNDRQQSLDLFDALGSTEKTLQANLGGHTGVPPWAGEDAARFFARHLT